MGHGPFLSSFSWFGVAATFTELRNITELLLILGVHPGTRWVSLQLALDGPLRDRERITELDRTRREGGI